MKPLSDDVWSVVAAMAGALKPPTAPFGAFLGAPLLAAPTAASAAAALSPPFLASPATGGAALKDLRASDTVLEGSRIT